MLAAKRAHERLQRLVVQAWPRVALPVGLDVVLLVIAIMGGRVIPSFTNNAIPSAGARRNRGSTDSPGEAGI